MRIVNYTFGQPRKLFIIALREAINKYSTQYPVLNNVHIGAIKQSPQAYQFDKEIVVTNTGFTGLENNSVREYGFSLYLYCKDFETMEDLTEAVDAVITTIRGNRIKWAEVESMIEDETGTGDQVRLLAINAIISATNM